MFRLSWAQGLQKKVQQAAEEVNIKDLNVESGGSENYAHREERRDGWNYDEEIPDKWEERCEEEKRERGHFAKKESNKSEETHRNSMVTK